MAAVKPSTATASFLISRVDALCDWMCTASSNTQPQTDRKTWENRDRGNVYYFWMHQRHVQPDQEVSARLPRCGQQNKIRQSKTWPKNKRGQGTPIQQWLIRAKADRLKKEKWWMGCPEDVIWFNKTCFWSNTSKAERQRNQSAASSWLTT